MKKIMRVSKCVVDVTPQRWVEGKKKIKKETTPTRFERATFSGLKTEN